MANTHAFVDISYVVADRIATITIERPEVRNAFRPLTMRELTVAFRAARHDSDVRVVVLTGRGDKAFSSGGDQNYKSEHGYLDGSDADGADIFDLQAEIRQMPKPTVAKVAGYAVGGGQTLQLMCDLTVAADNSVFGHAGPRVGSFDAGYTIGLLARYVGMRRAKELVFLCRRYDAQQALDMGLVNWVVPIQDLEAATVGICEELLDTGNTALRMMKAGFAALDDGVAGMQRFSNEAVRLYYGTDEAAAAYDSRGRQLTKSKPNMPVEVPTNEA